MGWGSGAGIGLGKDTFAVPWQYVQRAAGICPNLCHIRTTALQPEGIAALTWGLAGLSSAGRLFVLVVAPGSALVTRCT